MVPTGVRTENLRPTLSGITNLVQSFSIACLTNDPLLASVVAIMNLLAFDSPSFSSSIG